MHRGDRRLLIAGVVVALVVAAIVVIAVTRGDTSSTTGERSDVPRMISSDGAQLSAEVVTPKHTGRVPLLVMPAPWGARATVYRSVAALFAGSGYEVVSYAQRGFGGSTGAVDFAGAKTQGDARTVISWALKNTPADPGRVGMLGISYGGGIALLTAAHDPRVKAVVALSTWVDFADTFDQGQTPHTAGLRTLMAAQTGRAHYDATVTRLQDVVTSAPRSLGGVVRAMSPTRSPASYVTELNANKPAIMIANGFEDSITDAAQLVPFFDALTTPKRLQLAPGDHGGPERSALAGAPNTTIDDARAWLDHYLLGAANGIATQDPIVLEDVRSAAVHTFKTWPTASRVLLAAPGRTQTGKLSASSWTATIRAGTDSAATSGPLQFISSVAYRPPAIETSAIDPADAFVWDGPELPAGVVLAGTPSVRIGLSSSATTATVFAYLYDVSPAGAGSLVDAQPYTVTGLSPGAAKQVTVAMQPIAWTVPAGDHLTLVIDTVDPRYQSLTPAGATVTVSSTRSAPASISAPTGR